MRTLAFCMMCAAGPGVWATVGRNSRERLNMDLFSFSSASAWGLVCGLLPQPEGSLEQAASLLNQLGQPRRFSDANMADTKVGFSADGSSDSSGVMNSTRSAAQRHLTASGRAGKAFLTRASFQEQML